MERIGTRRVPVPHLYFALLVLKTSLNTIHRLRRFAPMGLHKIVPLAADGVSVFRSDFAGTKCGGPQWRVLLCGISSVRVWVVSAS